MKKNIKSFIREEDGKTIKKSILVSSLWLVTWFLLTSGVDAGHSNSSLINTHSSQTWTNYHSSTHNSHANHASY